MPSGLTLAIIGLRSWFNWSLANVNFKKYLREIFV